MRPARHIDVGSGPWNGDAGEWDGYRFGSESCSNLVPPLADLHDAASRLPQDRCVLVTPLLGPEELDQTLRCAAGALDAGWAEVVVNDWGLLYALSRLGAARISAGRLLMRFRRGPGARDAWDEYDEETRRYFAWGPLFDGPFLEFLREMGVGRVEADPPRHALDVPAPGVMAVSLHVQSRLISVVASCPWLYDPAADFWRDRSHCARPCHGRPDIVLHASQLHGPLRLRGRALIERIEGPWMEQDLPPWTDRLIFDELRYGTVHA